MLVNSRSNVRYFTTREMAKLQGYPDDFIISGSWKAATRQLGNAVPVQVGEKIGKEIIRLIRKNRINSFARFILINLLKEMVDHKR